MCDFFWLSPADQGDLSDVVRASLQQPPHHDLQATPAGDMTGLGSSYLQPEVELLQLEGGGGDCLVVSHGDQQLVHGLGMMMSGNTRPCCDHVLLQPPSTTYPQPQAQPHPQGMIRQMSRSPLQLGSADVEREGDVAAAPEIDDHMQMSMAPHPHVPTIKRRKSQTKKVLCIPAPTAAPRASGRPSSSGEVVPSDLWAWRKYGQKPIKGSPYPRGYYRCSSSKGCSARKQVERSRTDPNMLVITYTSEHNHPWPTQRNALAGSTRPSSSSAAAHHMNNPRPTYSNSSINTNDSSTSAASSHHQLKQELLDAGLDLFADMDALNIFSSNSNFYSKQQQAADDDDLQQEDDSKQQQLFDPFSFGFVDWVATTSSFGEANK